MSRNAVDHFLPTEPTPEVSNYNQPIDPQVPNYN